MNWPAASNKRTGRLMIGPVGQRPLLVVALIVLMSGWLTADAGRAESPGKSSDQIVSKWLSESLQAARSDSAAVIEWQVMSGAVTNASSESYSLVATGGQPADGISSSPNFSVSGGFWEVTAGTCCLPPIRGNVDYDVGDAIDISDLVYLVDYMFTGGPAPDCWEEGNVDGSDNGNGIEGSEDIDISDLVYLVDYMFTGGPEPLPCP